MRRGGRSGWATVVAGLLIAASACKTAPPAAKQAAPAAPLPAPAPPPRPAPPAAAGEPLPAFTAQPLTRLGEVDGIAVIGLGAPQFQALPRDQRLVAWFAAQAAAAGDAVTAEQGYRHNLAVIRMLRGILSRPQVVSASLLPRIRRFARLLYLNHGLHDAETGRKQAPEFTAAEFRLAAFAASAAGADLGLGGVRLEYALRALEGPLFDPRVDARRTVRGADLTASAVNFYEGVTLRDLQGFTEKAPLHSRLVKQGGAVTERVYRLPAAAEALERALPYSAPPQRAVFEPLSLFFRSGEPSGFEAAQRAWTEAFGPVDAFAGFVDTSADPRGQKALFGGFAGAADRERSQALDRVRLRNAAEALFLVAAAGAARPLRSAAFTLDGKTALFGAALDAEALARDDAVIAALADPKIAAELHRCAPSLRFAHLALREMSREPAAGEAVLGEALAEAEAHVRAGASIELLPDPKCRELYPHFVAAHWLASSANDADPADDDRLRANLLQASWFAGRKAVALRQSGGRPWLAVPDASAFSAAAQDLLATLRQVRGDEARWRKLLDQHGAHADPKWRDEARARLAAVPRRVAVLPPRLDAVLDAQGKPIDAQATPVQDLDEQILRDWAGY